MTAKQYLIRCIPRPCQQNQNPNQHAHRPHRPAAPSPSGPCPRRRRTALPSLSSWLGQARTQAGAGSQHHAPETRPARARPRVLYPSCCAHPPPFSIRCAVNGQWCCVQSGAVDANATVVCWVHALEGITGHCVLLSKASAGIHSLAAPAAPPWDHHLLVLLFHFGHPCVEQKS